MSDYTKTGPFVEDAAPALSPAFLNALETGVKDAAEHHKTGTLAARPPASAANKNWLYFATDSGVTALSDGAQWIPVAIASPVVTALPGAPLDGQEVFYRWVDTDGSARLWHLKYEAALVGSLKWHVIGDAPITHRVDSAEAIPSAGALVDLATVGPRVQVPLRGDYEYAFGFNAFYTALPTAVLTDSVLTDNANAVYNGGEASAQAFMSGAANERATPHREGRLTDVAAGAFVKMRYQISVASSVSFRYRYLSLKPVRVG